MSQDAVYKRIKRGTIPWDKGEDDKTYVYVEEVDESKDAFRKSTYKETDASNYVSVEELLSEMRSRIRFLEEEAQRKDTIIMSLTQRIPELEPAPEPRESPVTPTKPHSDTQAPQEEERPVSWWRRFFGF